MREGDLARIFPPATLEFFVLPTAARRARAPRLVLLLAAALLLSVVPAGAAHDAEPRAGDYQQVVELVFPTEARASVGDSYHACRSGCARIHKAADLMGQKMWKLFAATDGTVCHLTGVADAMPSYGYALTICGTDGREYRYLHLNNDTPGTDDGNGGPEWAYAPGIRRGATVTAGQWVGYMGDSGNAEGTQPHLHFDLFDDTVTDPYGDHRINPFPSLAAARASGRYAPAPLPPAGTGVDRVFGADRIETAARIAEAMYDRTEEVVLAPAGSFAEAVVAGPLAATVAGPVLLNGTGGAHPAVLAQIARLGARRATLVGDIGMLSAQLQADLAGAGVSVSRLAGADVYATAALVAERVWAAGVPDAGGAAAAPGDGGAGRSSHRGGDDGSDDAPGDGRRALLALATHPDPARAWPDALLASYRGALSATPVLLTDPVIFPPTTAVALVGVEGLTIVGGPAAVPEGIAAAAAGVLGSSGQVRRLAGANRFATATAVSDDAVAAGADLSWVWAAAGGSWADAVTAGPAAARARAGLILLDGSGRGGDPDAGRWLWRHGATIDSGRMLGGAAALSDAAVARFVQRTT